MELELERRECGRRRRWLAAAAAADAPTMIVESGKTSDTWTQSWSPLMRTIIALRGLPLLQLSRSIVTSPRTDTDATNTTVRSRLRSSSADRMALVPDILESNSIQCNSNGNSNGNHSSKWIIETLPCLCSSGGSTSPVMLLSTVHGSFWCQGFRIYSRLQ